MDDMLIFLYPHQQILYNFAPFFAEEMFSLFGSLSVACNLHYMSLSCNLHHEFVLSLERIT